MDHSFARYTAQFHRDFIDFCGGRLQRLGLSRGLLYFLLYVGGHPGCSPSELAAALHADTGHTARSLEKLEALGYLIRERRAADRRGYALRLTIQGEDAFAQSKALFGQWDRQVLAALSPGERRALLELLDKLARRAAPHPEEHPCTPPPSPPTGERS